MTGDDELGKAVGALAAGDSDAQGLRRTAGLVASSMRTAGTRSVATGRWLAELVLDVAPHVPARDLATLQAHHGGHSDQELADALIRNAARTTATLGAVAGAVAGAEELAPPTWLALPAELVAETLAVVAVEMKLVAELQAAYGRPVTGTPAQRGLAVARAWADQRGVTATDLVQPGGLSQALGRSSRRQVARLLQRRLTRRALRNLPTLAPFLIGAVAGAEVNRRATRSLGEAVVRDLLGGGGRVGSP
ncbi:MAG TPA: hypothetical protein VHS52_08620 [Acidimicrobiales bacterium]|nr:hypothetical protein [Acidimicrobiales bacterium]